MIKVIEKKEKNDELCVGTHNGIFHCDDVLATAMITILTGHVDVIRSRDIDTLKQADLIFDIGGGSYDHHQKGGNGERNNGVKYASAGLIWREFGSMIVERIMKDADIELDEERISTIVNDIDDIVQEVDKEDNGEKPFNHPFQFVPSFLPNWNNEEESFDKSFEECVEVVEKIFKQVILQEVRMYSCPIAFMVGVLSPDNNGQKINSNNILSEVIFSLINEKCLKKEEKPQECPDAISAWVTYGKDVVRSISKEPLTEEEMNMVLNYVAMNISLSINDNGSNEIFGNLFRFIANYKLDYSDEWEFQDKLRECLSVTKKVLKKVISKGISICLAPKETSLRVVKPETRIKNILVIPAPTFPWLDSVVNYNDNSDISVDFVVFPYPDGGYALQCVPPSKEDSFLQRIPLPEEWAGQVGSSLQEISGVLTATFCHNYRFFARANEYSDIIRMCQIATKEFGEKGSTKGN